MSLYDDKLAFAKYLNCRNVAYAIEKYSSMFEFNAEFKEFNETGKVQRIVDEIKLQTKLKNSISKSTKTHKQNNDELKQVGKSIINDYANPRENANVKFVILKNTDNTPYYILYEDGQIHSFLRKRLIKPSLIKAKGTSQKLHVVYCLSHTGSRKTFQLSRLIMFYFTQHDYETIDDMPLITHFNDNTLDNSSKNLRFASKGEMIKIARKSKLLNANDDTTFINKNIKRIEKLLNQGKTYDEICKKFKCSRTAIDDFIKNNNIVCNMDK